MNNCGACEASCVPEAGDLSATCANAKCTRVCKDGYVLAGSGHCYKGAGIIAVYYNTQWNPAFMYYNNGKGWTDQPGKQMTNPSKESGLDPLFWKYYEVVANELVFVFNNGKGQWDSKGGQNYHVDSPGWYIEF